MAGGYNGESYVDTAEAIPAPGIPDCPGDPADLPRQDDWLLAVTDAAGRPAMCGGRYNPAPTSCLAYFEGVWRRAEYSMLGGHLFGAAVPLGDGRYWVLGDDGGSTATEYFTGGSFEAGPSLPEEMKELCAAEVAPGAVFVGAAFQAPDRAYLYDEPSDTWARLPDIPLGGRYAAACGAVPAPGGGVRVVLAGGDAGSERIATTVVLDLDSGEWVPGPDLPSPVGFAASVPYEGTFLVVGGWSDDGGARLDTVLEYDWEGGGSWVAWERGLKEGRSAAAAVFVDPDVAGCPES